MKRRTPTTYRSLLAALLALALCLAPCLALAGGVNVEEARSSVFRVAVRDASGTVISFGSAFYAGKLEDNPVLVTNYHVVSKNPEGVNLWLNAQTELHCQCWPVWKIRTSPFSPWKIRWRAARPCRWVRRRRPA